MHRVSNLWTIINRDNERQRRKFLGGCGGMLPQKILKIGSLKTSFSALSGQNMWQNGTEIWWHFSSYFNLPKKGGYQVSTSTYTIIIKLHLVNAVLLCVPFIIYHNISLNIPCSNYFLFYDFSATPLLFKIGTFFVPTKVELGFGILSQNQDSWTLWVRWFTNPIHVCT